MFLYIKKYLFSFLGKIYGVMGRLTLFSLLIGIIIFWELEKNVFLRILISLSILVIMLILVFMIDAGLGKKKVESVNNDIEEKLEILKNKKLLESRIKNSKVKNNSKKYL